MKKLFAGAAILLIADLAWAEALDPAVDAALALETIATGLSAPTGAAVLPDGRVVVIEQAGGIKLVPAGGGAPIAAGSITVESDTIEQGLLGVAVDPEFATSRRLYFYYSRQAGGIAGALDRHRVGYTTLDGNTVDTGGLQEIVTGIHGPRNHNGGGLAFGPDGLLYIGTGDTGCNCGCGPGDATNVFPTCLSNLNGKILRVTREGQAPPSNPLVGVADVAACGVPASEGGWCREGPNRTLDPNLRAAPRVEIYNWGFRNPWRFSFDDVPPHHLWIGDVGETTWEEITISTGPGLHHGWPFREGAHGQARSSCAAATPLASACVEPTYELSHDEAPNQGQGSITGGVFSNHCSWPAPYRGRYWFGDYTKRSVWTLTPNPARDGVVPGSRQTIVTGVRGVVHFANDRDGSILFVSLEGGAIWRVRPETPASCGAPDAGPADLGPSRDAAPVEDATARDAGAADAGAPRDATEPDAAGPDAAVVDAVAPVEDASPVDAGAPFDADIRDSAVGDVGGADAGEEPPTDEGCGCRTGSPSGAGASLLLLLLGLRRRGRGRA